jgi:TonB family protein
MKPLAQERLPAADSKDVRAHRVEAVVVSSDDALLIELGPILGNRYRTHTVDTPAEIAATVRSPRWIGIVDVASLADARGAIARMELQYHRCPLIIVAANPEEWAGAVARGAVSAAVARHELAGPRLGEALSAAEARLRAENNSESAPAAADPARGSAAAGKVGARIALAALLAAILAAGLWWGLHRSGSADTSDAGAGMPAAANRAVPPGTQSGPPSAAGAAAAPARPQSVLELLSAARVAFSDQKLLLPRQDAELRGDSALELYAQVLKLQPDNDEALDGVKRLFTLGKARVQADLATGKLDDASRLVGAFRTAGIGNSELQPLDASISAARPKWMAARVQQDIAAGNVTAADQMIGQLTASGAAPASIAELRRALDAKKLDLQLSAMAEQVKAAITAGTLLEPANDNASTRLAAMRSLSRTSAVTLTTQRQLQAALLDRGQQATRSGQLDAARVYISAAADLGSSSEVTAARRALQAATEAASRQAAAAAAAAAAAQARAARATAPANPPNVAAGKVPAAAGTTLPRYVAARPVRPLDVTYPDGATGAGQVIVEFTLEPDGSASDPKVIQSAPRGMFDDVALRAVSSGYYDTRHLAGRMPPVRARILLRFKPN